MGAAGEESDVGAVAAPRPGSANAGVTALDHKKFSRTSDEPAHALLDPLPDHSDEVPVSLIKKPHGRLESTTTTTVEGSAVEHYHCQQNAANANLQRNVAKRYQGVMKHYEKIVEAVQTRRHDIFKMNVQTMEAMTEYVQGVKCPTHQVRPDRSKLVASCHLSVSAEEMDEVVADRRAEDVTLPEVTTLLEQLYRESPNRSPEALRSPTSPLSPPFSALSLTERVRLEERLAELIESPETVDVLTAGVQLRDADPLSYVKAELRSTREHIPDIQTQAGEARLRRDSAFNDLGGDRTDEGIQHHNDMVAQLVEGGELCHARMQCILLSRGELDEYTADAQAWMAKASTAVTPQIAKFAEMRERLQGDLALLNERKATTTSKGFDRVAKFTERKLKLLRDIKRSTQKQDQAIAAVIASIQRCSKIQDERVTIMTQLMEEVDNEARAATEEVCVVEELDDLALSYRGAIAKADRIATVYQTIHTDTIQGIIASLETQCDFSGQVAALKSDEPQNLADVFQEFAIETGDLILEREEELFSIEKALRHQETVPGARSLHFKNNLEKQICRRERTERVLGAVRASFETMETLKEKCFDMADRLEMRLTMKDPFIDAKARLTEVRSTRLTTYAEKEAGMHQETQDEVVREMSDTEYERMTFGYDPTGRTVVGLGAGADSRMEGVPEGVD